MEKRLTIKHKLKENIVLGTDEKGNDIIIYLKERIPDIKENGLKAINLNKEDYKLLLNMNEINFNIKEKIQKIEWEIFQHEMKKPQRDINQSSLSIFVFLLKVKLYKEYILNKLFGNIPMNDYVFFKDTYRLENVLIDYLIDLEKANGLISEDVLKIKDFLYLDTNLKDILFSLFRNINLKTNIKEIIKTYEYFNKTAGYLIYLHINRYNNDNLIPS